MKKSDSPWPYIVGIVVVIWFTWWANTLEPAPDPPRPETDRYFLQADQKRIELLQRTRAEHIEIFTLKAMGYGFSRDEARREAEEEFQAELDYYRLSLPEEPESFP